MTIRATSGPLSVSPSSSLVSASRTPDAIVVDINVPELDGVSAVTALRAMDKDVPVCVLSARSSVDDRVPGLDAGADDYLFKPPRLLHTVPGVGFVLRAQ